MAVQMLLYKIITDPFQRSLDKLADQNLPVKAMYKLKTIISLLRDEYKKFDELRNDIAKKHADKTDTGVPIMETNKGNVTYKIGDEQMFAFAAELGQLSKVEVDIPCISINDLGGDVKLTTNDLILLDFITEE
jgi:7-keto-8-aminopelargonate synthetase-like enzyme